MAYNLGYVSTSYNLGYVGAYTGGLYPYVLTSHGVADTNSFMASANFGTTQPVDIGVVTDFDSAKIVVDWQAVSDGQLWRDDINTLAAVTVNATTDTTATCTLAYRVTETGETGTFDVTVNVVAEVTATVPQGTTTIGTISKTETTASIPYTYSGTDQTGFEYSLNGGTWLSAPNPVELADLTDGTSYNISVRPFNTAGTGTAGTASFTTDAVQVPQVPQFAPVIGTITKDTNSASIPFTYPGSDATSFQASTNGVDWVTVTSPISRTGLSASTAYSGQVRAVNAAGTGTAASYNFTTEAAPSAPSIFLSGLTSPYVVIGETWTDQGARATDDIDGDITGSITTTGTVNTAAEGVYEVIYSVTNSGGLTSTVSRFVQVGPAIAANTRKKVKRRTYTAYMYGRWANRFRGNNDR